LRSPVPYLVKINEKSCLVPRGTDGGMGDLAVMGMSNKANK